MNSCLIMVIAPFGLADKIIESAAQAGATGATTIHARGAETPAKEGFLSLVIEPEEEIVLIVATKESTEDICGSISKGLKSSGRNASVYVLPVNRLNPQ